MTRAVVLSLAFLLPQAATPARGVLQGRVVELSTNRPVVRASIVAAKVGGPITDYRTVTTDQAGRFAITDLARGSYRIFAQRDGYLQSEYGRRAVSTAGTPIPVGEARASDIVITMTPTGVITGHVFDRNQPARNVFVRALRARYLDGNRSLSAVEWAQTNDQGEYRLFGLAPGLYFIRAVPQGRPRIDGDELVTPAIPSNANGNRAEVRTKLSAEELPVSAFSRDVYVPVYYPSITDISTATPVELRAGATLNAIDLAIAPTTTFRVAGRVVIVGTAPAESTTVGVVPVEGANQGRSVSIVSAQTIDGQFELASVAPGSYYLTAQARGRPSGQTAGAFMGTAVPFKVVDRDVTDLTATLRPGVRVKGRVSIDGRAFSANDPRISVQLTSNAPLQGYAAVVVGPDGAFSIETVAPRDYRFRVLQVGRTQWIKSARFGTEDVLTNPIRVEGDLQGRELEIVLSPNTAVLDALVLDRNQRPVQGALVIAVPDFAKRSRSELYRTGNTDASGRVQIDGISPGEYRLFATEDIDAAAWQDPDVLRIYEGSGHVVHFPENGKENVTLRLVP